ncbi:MAG TPA: hypothetical protein VEO20_01965 [Thermoplasmata archaeon]|nr:hypothetical protein [Thermoplasmata archaeon]
MWARLAVPIAVALLVLSAGSAVEVRALTAAVDVVVLLDRTSANYGQIVNVTVHVFDRGAPVDPSVIGGVTDRLPGRFPLNLTRDSVGVFTGSFVFQSHPTLVIVNATVDGTEDSGTAAVFHRFPLSVQVVPSVGVALPGGPVSVEVDVAGANGPVDPDSLDLSADVFAAPPFTRISGPTSLSATRIGVGRYVADYTIPSTVDRDAVVDFRANVMVGGSGTGVGASVYVEFPSELIVWYRSVPSGSSNQTFAVYVASTAGVPLANAKVSITYDTVPFGTAGTLNATTNPTGAAVFDIGRNDTVFISFFGTASYGAASQPFQGSIVPSGPVPLSEPRMIRTNPDETFAPGQTANLQFLLEQNGSALSEQELFVYAHAQSAVVFAGRLMTDAAGRFAIHFVAPLGSTRLEIAGFIGGAWRAFREDFVAEYRLSVALASDDGRKLSISIQLPSPPGPWVAQVMLSSPTEPIAADGSWAASGSFGVAGVASGPPGGSPRLLIQLPTFLSAGVPIVVSIYATTFRWQGVDNSVYVFRQTIVVGSPIAGPVDVVPLILFTGLAFVVAMVIVVRLWRRPPKSLGRAPDGSGPEK